MLLKILLHSVEIEFFFLGAINSGTIARALTERVRRSDAAGNVDARSDCFGLHRSGETGA